MDNKILVFLEAYKSLDELCKQIFQSERGITEYIDEMSNNGRGRNYVSCWDEDFRQLKKLRWVRNKLVHEVNSFEEDSFSEEDIAWLKSFRSKIIEMTDPLVLLYQKETSRIETPDRHDKHIRNGISPSPSAKQEKSVLKSAVGYVFWTVIIFLAVILSLFCIIAIVFDISTQV